MSACGWVASSSAEPWVSAAVRSVMKSGSAASTSSEREVRFHAFGSSSMTSSSMPTVHGASAGPRGSSRPSARSCRAHPPLLGPRTRRPPRPARGTARGARGGRRATPRATARPGRARGPSLSRPSTTPSGAHATACSPWPRRSADWWWNELTSASVTPITRASREAGSIRTECVVMRPRAAWRCSIEPSVKSPTCWCSEPPRATLSACTPRQMPSTGIPRASASWASASS